MPVNEQDVMSALKSCYDPEIPVNIVDLGLIYKVNFAPAITAMRRRTTLRLKLLRLKPGRVKLRKT